ncbi:hypothetical protein B0H17DRAFT_1173646, partial [Mycena rosella]
MINTVYVALFLYLVASNWTRMCAVVISLYNLLPGPRDPRFAPPLPSPDTIETVYLALLLCLMASNLTRLWRGIIWVSHLIPGPRDSNLVPYYDREGQLIGMIRVAPVNPRLNRGPILTHNPGESLCFRPHEPFVFAEYTSKYRLTLDTTEGIYRSLSPSSSTTSSPEWQGIQEPG